MKDNLYYEEKIEIKLADISTNISIMRTLIEYLNNEFEEHYNSYDTNVGNILILLKKLTRSLKNKFYNCETLIGRYINKKQTFYLKEEN